MDLDDSYMATNMIAFICGDTDSNTDANNTCNKENIASPDNVAYVAGHDGLIIGALLHCLRSRAASRPCIRMLCRLCYCVELATRTSRRQTQVASAPPASLFDVLGAGA